MSPDNCRIYEMLKTPEKQLVGNVIDVYQPAPFSYDPRQRWCIHLETDQDWGYYGLFYEHEIVEVIV